MPQQVNMEEVNSMPLNILLVDDNETDVKITLRAFKNARIKNNIQIVSNGQECLDYLRHEGIYGDAQKYPRPDLILLDIKMPKIDGFGVLKSLKWDKDFGSIPIVVLTASKNKEDVMRSYGNGANSFIQKPVSYEKFIEFVDGFNYYWHIINKLPGREK